MLSNLELKFSYTTANSDIGREFYSPVLSESIIYDRVSGYFNSSAFLSFAEGIHGLINNKGKYRLIISNQISERDYESIKEGYANRNIYQRNIERVIKELSQMPTKARKDICNLAYLIEIGLIDIKIGFTKDGLFHAKYGYMEDTEGNAVYFTGSLNETGSAFKRNYEEITVTRSWIDESFNQEIPIIKSNFEKLWENEHNQEMIYVKDANELLKRDLMKFSKGKIIMDYQILEKDALILYYDNGIKIQDNLVSHEIDESNRRIRNIKNQFLVDGKLWEFKPNIGYSDIETKIIQRLQKYAKAKRINFIVSESIYEYIESNKFEIAEIARRGRLIKAQNDSLSDELNRFEDIVQNEVSRPLVENQSWAAFYMAKMKRVSNFSVPGSGKTAMVLGSYAYLSSDIINKIDRMVVISPKSAFKSWIDEFGKVFGTKRELKVLNIHSDDFREEDLEKNINRYNLFLFNYESLNRYYEQLINIMDSRTMIIFDEIHKIKKFESDRSKIAIDISQKTDYRYALTGTPIPNSYLDIWNMLHILYKEEYKNFFGFKSNQLTNPDVHLVSQINEKLEPFFWRITKKDLNVPPANDDKLIRLNASEEEQAVINMLWSKYRHNPLVLYLRLIQLASNPSLLTKKIERNIFADSQDIEADDDISTLDIFEFEDELELKTDEIDLVKNIKSSTKFEEAISYIKILSNDKRPAIVWCYFIDTINKLSDRLNKLGIRTVTIHGSISLREREEIIDDFKSGKYDVLITNPQTLAESVSLHEICHDAIYLEWSFNLTHMLQSRDRIHRLGLKKGQETNYYYFMLTGNQGENDPIDEKMYYRLREKAEIMYEAIENDSLQIIYDGDEKQEIIDMMKSEMKN